MVTVVDDRGCCVRVRPSLPPVLAAGGIAVVLFCSLLDNLLVATGGGVVPFASTGACVLSSGSGRREGSVCTVYVGKVLNSSSCTHAFQLFILSSVSMCALFPAVLTATTAFSHHCCPSMFI